MYQLQIRQVAKDPDGAPLVRGTILDGRGSIGEWHGDRPAGAGQVIFASSVHESAFAAWAVGYLANCRDFEGNAYVSEAMAKAEIIGAALLQMGYVAFEAAMDASCPRRSSTDQNTLPELKRSCVSCGACAGSAASPKSADRGLTAEALLQVKVCRPRRPF